MVFDVSMNADASMNSRCECECWTWAWVPDGARCCWHQHYLAPILSSTCLAPIQHLSSTYPAFIQHKSSIQTCTIGSTCNCIPLSERRDQELSNGIKYIKIGPLLMRLEANRYQHPLMLAPHFTQILGLNHQSTTKVTLKAPPNRKRYVAVGYPFAFLALPWQNFETQRFCFILSTKNKNKYLILRFSEVSITNQIYYKSTFKHNILLKISAATEYLNCVYTEVELICGKEAALWQEGFDDTLIQPILQLVGCQLGMWSYIF